MTIRERAAEGSKTLSEIVCGSVAEVQTTPMDGIVRLRVAEIMDASPIELGLTDESMTVWGHVEAMVSAAYRAGLRDGGVRLGELA